MDIGRNRPPLEENCRAGTWKNSPGVVAKLARGKAFSVGQARPRAVGDATSRTISLPRLSGTRATGAWHSPCFSSGRMKTLTMTETTNAQDTDMNEQAIIHMPMGLLGFEHVKRYVLLSHPEEAPFLWLQMLDDPNLAFLCVSPLHVSAGYQPDLCPGDVDFLQLAKPDEALIVNIVTLHPDGEPTVNLKGPVVINRRTLIGKQVVPSNAAEYASQHPLPVAS